MAVLLIFAINGLLLSNWVPRIPAVQEHLGLSEGQLGLALLGPAIGAIGALPAAGWFINRFGSRVITTIAVMALSLSLVLPGLAVNLITLLLALVVLGAANGALDVSMNSQGVAVEHRYGRPILSSFHAAFSFGGLIGAGMAALAAGLGLVPWQHFLIVALAFTGVSFAVSRGLLPAGVDKIGRVVRSSSEASGLVARFQRMPRRLLLIGLVGFCCLVGEGAMADWTAVYLRSDLATSESFAAAGFAAFSLTMAVGRLVGDRLATMWGPVAIVRYGGAIVAVALAASLLVDSPVAAVIGFGAVGAGLAGIVPVAFSAAGKTPNMAAGTSIAIVSSLAYSGFLAGPPIIGFIAEVTGLSLALGVVVLMGVALVFLASSVAPLPKADS